MVLVDGQPTSLIDTNILSAGTHFITARQSGGTFMGLYTCGEAPILLFPYQPMVQSRSGKAGGLAVQTSPAEQDLVH